MTESRDAHNWAKPVSRLEVGELSADAINLNVAGRKLTGPLQGFGQLWQKTYQMRLDDPELTPEHVAAEWKANLPRFMPDDSRFYPSITGVKPGEVVMINATLPGVPTPVSTGVLIMYADETSFSVMTPEGHPESGFNTFSAFRDGDHTVAQIQSLARANDPIFEFGFRFMGGSAQQERIWRHVLTSLSEYFGTTGTFSMQKQCVDNKVQWSRFGNVWHNSVIRTALYAPVHLMKRLTRK